MQKLSVGHLVALNQKANNDILHPRAMRAWRSCQVVRAGQGQLNKAL